MCLTSSPLSTRWVLGWPPSLANQHLTCFPGDKDYENDHYTENFNNYDDDLMMIIIMKVHLSTAGIRATQESRSKSELSCTSTWHPLHQTDRKTKQEKTFPFEIKHRHRPGIEHRHWQRLCRPLGSSDLQPRRAHRGKAQPNDDDHHHLFDQVKLNLMMMMIVIVIFLIMIMMKIKINQSLNH